MKEWKLNFSVLMSQADKQTKKKNNKTKTNASQHFLYSALLFPMCNHAHISHTMCGSGTGKHHMLCWYLCLVLELWVMETSSVQTAKGHFRRAGLTSEDELDKDTWEQKKMVKMKRQHDHHIQPCFWDLLKICLLLQHHQKAKRICGKQRGAHMTSRKQADSAGRAHVGAGVWSMAEWVTSCQCSLQCEFCVSSRTPSLGSSRTN